VRIQISRDSVAAGDDVVSHDEEVEFDQHRPFAELLQSISIGSYLARIGGGRATWAVLKGRGGRPLAIMAEQWTEPVLIVDRDTLMADIGNEVYFRYLAQRDPHKVLAQVLAAKSDEELATALDPYGPI